MIDNDGWEHTDLTDLFAIHDYARNGELLYEKYKDVPSTGIVPANGREALAPGLQVQRHAAVSFRVRRHRLHSGGHAKCRRNRGATRASKRPRNAALERLRGQFAAIAKLPFAGICYTQLTDVEQEVNGLMTYDRKPKFPVEKVKEIVDLLGR